MIIFFFFYLYSTYIEQPYRKGIGFIELNSTNYKYYYFLINAERLFFQLSANSFQYVKLLNTNITFDSFQR